MMNEEGINKHVYKKLLHEQQERLKELACINHTTAILKEGRSVEETLRHIVMIIPDAWQYPEYTEARITFNGAAYTTPGFTETEWQMLQAFTTIDNEKGSIEVYYLSEFRNESEGPFLAEERNLIGILASLITGYINSHKAKDIIRTTQIQFRKEVEDESPVSSRKLLQKFLDRHNAERDVFHDLNPFKVREILLIANLYDAYSIEGEGRFSDHLLGEYNQLSLTSIPRVTGVSGEEEAFSRLKSRHYDLIIIMIGVDKENPMNLCKKIKELYPYIPTFLLLSNQADIGYVIKQKSKGIPFDNYFVWTGESKVFFAMVKLLEDSANVENDTKKGLTRVILIVEDSADYYSSYLPLLYSLVMEQTKSLIEEVSTDELYKVLKLRARPKILLATTFEEALMIYNKYRENLLCVISDMRFPKDGVLTDLAGFELIKHIKADYPNLPSVLQSSDSENARYAFELKANFINKNSESLLQDLKSFITYYLGFGHFVYRDNKGRQIAVAKSMKEFEAYLETVPEDSLVYHAMKNHFSLWLMARGEVKIAQMINPIKVSDFNSLRDVREFLIDIIRKRRIETNRGKVVNFEESATVDDTNIVSLAGGSLGGKGRGLAFINTLINSFELGKLTPGINIRTPVTAVIGTDEFDMFMERNHIWERLRRETDYWSLQKSFLEGSLSYSLEKMLRILMKQLIKPVAVRSSSLFEDSMSQPFSGIFGTYLLPNNNPDFDIRYKQLTDAIKLVFASVYSKISRTYFEAINYKIEQEKMAIVIQEVVGNRFEDAFYPHVSGTAQSHNYYPVSHMVTEEGFAVMAVGLGQYVAEGDKAFRFSPAYPKLDIISQNDLFRNSQTMFYAVDMRKNNPDLLEGESAGLVKLDISDAERHGTLKHSASVYNRDNDSIVPGLDAKGPRVINFADILKYDHIPVARTIATILDVVKEAFGTSVEIEYAVDFTKDEKGNASFYLLQVKPMVGSGATYSIDTEQVDPEKLLVLSSRSMGNGIIEDINDLIYIDPADFNNLSTEKMAGEIDRMNQTMLHENRKYVLMGPGRWGTHDRFIGIPVAWPQISNARVIIEVGLPDFQVDASLGSHFFHNVTSMNVGYFSVHDASENEIIRWDVMRSQQVVERGIFFTHIRFPKPLLIMMDGRKQIAAISYIG